MTIMKKLIMKKREYRELENEINNREITKIDREKFESLQFEILGIEEDIFEKIENNKLKVEDITNSYILKENKLKFGIDEYVSKLNSFDETLLIRNKRTIYENQFGKYIKINKIKYYL